MRIYIPTHSLCTSLTMPYIELCIEAQEYKVHPGTEEKIYNDSFFSRQDIVVNALDNVEARRYVDRLVYTSLHSV